MRFERDDYVRDEHVTSLATGAGHFIESVTVLALLLEPRHLLEDRLERPGNRRLAVLRGDDLAQQRPHVPLRRAPGG
jgi:hypothetical protein